MDLLIQVIIYSAAFALGYWSGVHRGYQRGIRIRIKNLEDAGIRVFSVGRNPRNPEFN